MTNIEIREEQLFSVEEAKKRWQIGLQLSKIITFVMGGIIFILAATYFLTQQQYAQLLIVTSAVIIFGVGIGLYPYFYKQGKAQIGAYLAIFGFLVVIVISLEILPELMVIAGLAYTAVISLSLMILGNQKTVVVIVAATVAFLINLVSARVDFAYRWFTPLDTALASWLLPIMAIITLPTVGVIIFSIMKGQDVQFRQAFRSNVEVEQRAAEREEREHLQSTIDRYVEYLGKVALGDLSAACHLEEQKSRVDDPLIMLGRQPERDDGQLAADDRSDPRIGE